MRARYRRVIRTSPAEAPGCGGSTRDRQPSASTEHTDQIRGCDFPNEVPDSPPFVRRLRAQGLLSRSPELFVGHDQDITTRQLADGICDGADRFPRHISPGIVQGIVTLRMVGHLHVQHVIPGFVARQATVPLKTGLLDLPKGAGLPLVDGDRQNLIDDSRSESEGMPQGPRCFDRPGRLSGISLALLDDCRRDEKSLQSDDRNERSADVSFRIVWPPLGRVLLERLDDRPTEASRSRR
jgi:hypothetical protein